jgi:hypothetical protein
MITKELILRICNEEIFNKIFHIFENSIPDSAVDIAMHNLESRKDDIYFVIDSDISFYDIGKITVKIEEAIGCSMKDEEENIFIFNKKRFEKNEFGNSFKDFTKFENFSAVQDFLKKYYFQYFEQKNIKKSFLFDKENVIFEENEEASVKAINLIMSDEELLKEIEVEGESLFLKNFNENFHKAFEVRHKIDNKN